MKLLILTAVLLLSGLSYAGTYSCKAYGNSGVGGNDAGPFVVDAEFNVTLFSSDEAYVDGHVKVAGAWQEYTSPEQISEDYDYIGIFESKNKINKKYRPTKYKGYKQIKDVNAVVTLGSEPGMWGYIALQTNKKDKSGIYKAVYIFQAGDHMGGTIYLNCLKN